MSEKQYRFGEVWGCPRIRHSSGKEWLTSSRDDMDGLASELNRLASELETAKAKAAALQTRLADLERKHAAANRFAFVALALDSQATAGRITAGPWAVPREEVWLHELAHCIIPGGHHHDRLWVRTFLELVRLRMGREAHDLLRDAFRRRRVKFTPYRRVAFTEEMRDKLAACRPAAIKVSSGSQP